MTRAGTPKNIICHWFVVSVCVRAVDCNLLANSIDFPFGLLLADFVVSPDELSLIQGCCNKLRVSAPANT
jgi:hypothetical protein